MSRNYCKPDHSCQEGGEEGLFRVKWIGRSTLFVSLGRRSIRDLCPTHIICGYFPRSLVLSDCPSQNIFGHKQGIYEQWKAMLDKRRKWVPYPPL